MKVLPWTLNISTASSNHISKSLLSFYTNSMGSMIAIETLIIPNRIALVKEAYSPLILKVFR